MTKEIWRPIDGFPNYEISNMGRTRSIDRTIEVCGAHKKRTYKARVRSPVIDRRGYCHVPLWANNKQKMMLVHRLVAAAFLRQIVAGEEVNHIDFDKGNNALSNLEIVTRAENFRHATDAGRLANKKLDEIEVREIKFSLLWGDNKYQIAERFHVDRVNINAIIAGKIWKRVDLPAWLAAHN